MLTLQKLFDSQYYLAKNPDVAQAVSRGQFASAFDHFTLFGQFEGRNPSASFDTSFYLATNPDVAQAVSKGQTTAAQQFIQFGQFEQRNPDPIFNTQYYLNTNPDVATAASNNQLTPFQHFLQFGQFEQRNPSQYFSTTYYLQNNPDVAKAVQSGIFTPTGHYLQFGEFENRSPSSLFNSSYYLQQNPDVVAAVSKGIVESAIAHYIEFGQKEGRVSVSGTGTTGTTGVSNPANPPIPGTGTLAFTSPQFSVKEDGTPITAITVTRSGGQTGAVSATINLRDGTAKASVDYNNTPIVVNFANGETSKTVTIPLVNSTNAQPSKTLQLTLTTPVGGATIGQQNSATLTIVDDKLLITGFPQGASGSNKGQTTIVIAGQKLSPTDQVSLVGANGTVRTASQVYWVNDTETWATFDLQGLSTGKYDVKVTNSTDTATSNAAFTVTGGSQGNVQVKLSYPTAGVVTVTYTNVGQTDITAPLFRLSATNAQVTYTQGYTTSATLSQLLDLGLGTSNTGPAGILAPGESGSFSLQYKANGNGPISFTVNQVNPNDVIDWAKIKTESRKDYSFIDSAAWDAIWNNFTAAVGQTFGQFQTVMAADATHLSQLGEETNNLTRLYNFQWQQAENTFTNIDLLNITDVVDTAPGLSLSFERKFYNSLAERYNLGALGRGWDSQWDLRATTDSNGDVVIRSAGDLQRLFQLQSDGSYLEQGGATLTITHGVYRLKETNSTVSSFGSDGKLNYVEDTNGNRITLQYTNNLLTKLVHSNGDSLTLNYNTQGRISQITASTGQVTSYSYDASGENLLSVTTPQGTTTYTYDTGNVAAKKFALLSVVSAQGYQHSYEYDNQGRLTKEFSTGQTQTLNYSYDNTGDVTITDSTGVSETILLDDLGNEGQIRGVNNQNLVLRYDANGNLINATLPNGSQSSYSYNTLDSLTQQTNLLGQKVNFTYDATFNQLIGFTDPQGNGVRYGYDAKGNLTQITCADGSTQQFSVDAAGNITSSVNRQGSAIQYTYNKNGQLTKKQYADGSSNTYSYDLRGNLTSVTDATGTTTLQYDAANHLTGISYPTGLSLQYTYNADGQRTKLVSQDGYTVNYSYDAVGRLKTLSDGTGQSIVSYDYDSAGRLIKKTNGNGTYTTYEYNIQGQLTRLINYQANNTVNSQFAYIYDSLGQRTSMTTLDGTYQYGYDAAGQLTSVVTPTNDTITYQYDAAGNRIGVTDNGTKTNYSSNNLNEYTTVGNAVYSYDKNGNLISKTEGGQTSTYTYDAENRLIKVVTPQGTWEYQYDGLGNRIATIVNGQRTEYLLDPTGLGNIVGQYDSNGNLVAHYDQGIGLVSRVDGNNASDYYDADALGSTVGLTGTNGSYVDRYSYLPFGESLTKVETVANPFQYVGQWGVTSEGNGLDFMRARFYDSGLGRFTAADPIGINSRDTNFYRYGLNSPINLNDPLGLTAQCPVLPPVENPTWKPYQGDSSWFHCGFNGYLENRKPTPDNPQGECFYDDNGNLVDQNHPYSGCRGTPDQYDSKDNPFLHTVWDDGGILWAGGPAFVESRKYYIYKGLESTLEAFVDFVIYHQIDDSTDGDPHLTTLDRIHYDFQAAGEFTLLKSTIDDFEIQTRQQPWGSSTRVAVNTAVALKIDGQRLGFYLNDPNPVKINGTATTIADGTLYAVGQDLITRNGSTYTVFSANGDAIQVTFNGSFLNLGLGLAADRKGKVVGLLGNDNGNTTDDFALRDGTIIGGTITNQELYGDYANSWRITQPTSLFDYPAGQNTNTFTDLTFPKNIVTTATLPADQRTAAQKIAQNAGITDPTLLQDATLDIAATNNAPEFVQGYVNQQQQAITNGDNTLISPNGFGTSHWLTANSLIPTTIRFTNDNIQGTNPIAQVTISQQLDPNLDLNTFSLGNFGFGNITINVPTGAQNYSQRLDLRSTEGVFVDVNAGLNPTTGVVTWTFTAIDPTTGNPVTNNTQGFLPPNDQTGGGQGFVTYNVQPKANTTSGTRINEQATITFNNTPQQTLPTFNTIDSKPPTSTVTALPSTSNNPNFTVSWTGSDADSGLASYDIYVSTDNGQFVPWQTNTTATSATYNGQLGHTYAFYSIARDNVGNVEAPPTTPEAKISLASGNPGTGTNGNGTSTGTSALTLQSLFDTQYYLAKNPDVAQAVSRGQFTSAFDQFLRFGQFEGRNPSAAFDTSFYLATNPDVAQAVSKGQTTAAQQFIQFGQFEQRNPDPIFNTQYYLNKNPDVATAVKNNQLTPFEHFLQFGQFEQRNPSQYFSTTYYLQSNPDVAKAVQSGTTTAARHYLQYGEFENRNPSTLFNSNFYLERYPDVLAAVIKGIVESAFVHYIEFGQKEGRIPFVPVDIPVGPIGNQAADLGYTVTLVLS